MTKPTLLITDTDSKLCEIYQQFISQFGFGVETATNGSDCLKKWELVNPLVLVLDRELPFEGGKSILDRLNQESNFWDLPVILTAPAMTWQDSDQLVGPPLALYLPKPFTPIMLLESVCSVIGKIGVSKDFNRNRFRVYSELFNA